MRKKKIKERTPIEVIVKVETLKNGYSLDVDGKGYMYFDVVELAKGLILHAGLGRTSPTTKFGRDSLLKAIGNGSAEKKLQQEINKLQEEVNKRGIKVKRCCASCKYKEIDDYGKRHCTKGFDSCETCRSWRMRDELRKAGTPFGVIKTKEYEYCSTNKEINSIINL